MTLAFIEGLFSPTHLLILAFICLLIFGRRLPEIGRSMGRGITEFKKGLREAGDEVSGHPQDPYQQQYNPNQFPPGQQQQQRAPYPPQQQYQQQPQYPQQQYQQPYPPQSQYQQQGGQAYPPQAPMGGPRMAPPPPPPGPGAVRVTRNDIVD